MSSTDRLVLTIFHFIGGVAGIIACALILLVGMVLCYQIPWWIVKQTAAWIRIARVMRKAALLRKSWMK